MNEAIQKLIMEVVMNVVRTKLVAALPFLGWPIIGPIFGMVLSKVMGIVAEQIGLMIEFQIINVQVNRDRKKYDEAVEKLKVELEKPEGERDEAAIQKAKEDFKARLRDLVTIKP